MMSYLKQRLLIEECQITYDVAHCVIGYLFVLVTDQDLAQVVRNRWEVLVSPRKK